MAVILLLLSLLLCLGQSHANVEKTIFLGPAPAQHHSHYSALSRIPRLSPENTTIRTQLHSKFEHSPAIDTVPPVAWYVLDGLNPGTRYEVRVCWAAVQPTAFELDTFTATQVREEKLLLLGKTDASAEQGDQSSWLLLRVTAQADFFTTNQTLMRDGLIVDVDLILDPYLLNLAPKSLIPTGFHILMVGSLAVLAVSILLKHLDKVVGPEIGGSKDKKA